MLTLTEYPMDLFLINKITSLILSAYKWLVTPSTCIPQPTAAINTSPHPPKPGFIAFWNLSKLANQFMRSQDDTETAILKSSKKLTCYSHIPIETRLQNFVLPDQIINWIQNF